MFSKNVLYSAVLLEPVAFENIAVEGVVIIIVNNVVTLLLIV